MLTGEIRSQIDRIWDAFWSGGISNPLEVMEQITYLLFLRRLDDLQQLEESKSRQLKRPIERRIFPEGSDPKGCLYDEMRWSRFKHLVPAKMFEVAPAYLRRYFDSVVTTLERRARGVAQVNINSGILRSLPIPVPPLAEQRRIAAVLGKADALRTKRCAALVQLDTLTQAIFLDLFGDPITNPKGWPTRQLHEVAKAGAIVTYGIVQAGEEYPGGVPYIRTGDIVDGEILQSDLRHTNPEIAARFQLCPGKSRRTLQRDLVVLEEKRLIRREGGTNKLLYRLREKP